MFSVEPASGTMDKINMVGTKSFFDRTILPRIDLVEMGVLIKTAINQNMAHELGQQKASHFSVSLLGTNQYGINVRIEGDQVGILLIHGSPPHAEFGSPMAFDIGEAVVFTSAVEHPGFPGIQEQVTAIVEKSVIEAVAYMKGGGI